MKKFLVDLSFKSYNTTVTLITAVRQPSGEKMRFRTVFKRYEFKYLITEKQKSELLRVMEPYMELDQYGRTTIRNIYFDTHSYRLIRRSIEKPIFKEKLRIRSYKRATPESTVFVELKRKYDSVVYKRRISLTEKEAAEWVCERHKCRKDTQISREIDYFLDYYGDLCPKVFLSYEREAYFARDGGDFRVTFDDNIIFRRDDLSLESDVYGTPILEQGKVLMELKCMGGIPLWMVEFLSKEHIYKTSFSKYGEAYKRDIFPDIQKNEVKKSKEDRSYVC